jgi:hypothetical protein
MIKHLAWIAGITLVLCLCIIYPFLPGDYDSLALPLSMMAQVAGVFGLLLVPVGTLWLASELRRRARVKQGLEVKARGPVFVLIAALGLSVIALILTVVALATAGPSLAALMLALWLYTSSRVRSKLWPIKQAESEGFNPAPLYLLMIPLLLMAFEITAAAPAAAFSRDRAIRASTEMIADIEAYHGEQGHYPSALMAVWKDYYPSVRGIEKYHYWSEGDAYNLYFEQPLFILDNFGTREFVVYNPLDEHIMRSHTSWTLILTPEELEDAQGWYAVNDATIPHWKYFWFD